MTDEPPPKSRRRWRGFVIVCDFEGVRMTLEGLRAPQFGGVETIYEFVVDPPYPVTFATKIIAQVWLDLMPPELRARCSIDEN